MATPPKFTDPVDLREKIEAYFQHCEDSRTERELKNGDIRIRQETPSMIGLATWLQCSPDTLYSYINGEDKSKQIADQEIYNTISGTLARARDRCAAALAQRAVDGDCDSRTAALLLGSYGIVQKSEVATKATVVIEGATAADVEDWAG